MQEKTFVHLFFKKEKEKEKSFVMVYCFYLELKEIGKQIFCSPFLSIKLKINNTNI